jgi:hypothetical protein
MQKLPIGIQSFEKIRTENYLYVDKTEEIYNLLNSAGYYFLSRPRRFGKSLLVSTLKEIFLGKKELFKGLFIEDKIEWNTYSVLHFNWTEIDYKVLGLEKAIEESIFYQASLYEIELETKTIHTQLQELVRKLYKKYNQQVVLLIDEYDKPIIDFLGDDQIHIAQENREIMKNFYAPIKSLDNELRFFFLTGVSKFTKVSVFSDLNHLNDITVDENFSTLVGYTQKEVEFYFDEHINKLAKKYKLDKKETLKQLKEWYNGYSWTGEETVYNPFSIMNALQKSNFNNYWFETGTPTFLIKLMQKGNYYDMDNQIMDVQSLGNFNITNIQPITVLFQTGYLTLVEDLGMNVYRLGYPNKEVKNSMLNMLLNSYTFNQEGFGIPLAFALKQAFLNQDFEKLFIHFTALFSKIPFQIFEQYKESYYHTIIFLTFELLGFYIDAEVNTSKGRIDAVVKSKEAIFIFEFKVNSTPQIALDQIKEKKYADKYLSEKENGKTIFLLGVNFQNKTEIEYLVEEL